MKFKMTALALALAGVAGTAQAGNFADAASAFSYDSIGVSYVDSTASTPVGDAESDGFGVNLSLSLTPNFYTTVGFLSGESDDGSVESTSTSLGLGYHRDLGLSMPVDFFGQVGLTNVNAESGSSDASSREFAWDGKVGIRSGFGLQGLDTQVYVGLAELNHYGVDANNDVYSKGYELSTQYGVSADYFVANDISLGVAYDLIDVSSGDVSEVGFEEVETVSFAAKYHF